MVRIVAEVCIRSKCVHRRPLYGGLCCEYGRDHYGNLKIGKTLDVDKGAVPDWCEFKAEHTVSQVKS